MKKKLFAFILSTSLVFLQTFMSFAETQNVDAMENESLFTSPVEDDTENTFSSDDTEYSTSEKSSFTDYYEGEDGQYTICNNEPENKSVEDSVETFAAGNSISNATSIVTGTNYSGSITSSNSANYYRFTITSSGRITLTATAGLKWIYYYIYDNSGNRVWRTNASWDSNTELINTNEKIDLTKGTYYFAAAKDGSNTGNYSFKLNFESAYESFCETEADNNNTISSANLINVNTNYNGQIASNDEKDFYKFTLSSSGRIVISATAKMKYIYYYIYNDSGKRLWYVNPSWNETTETIATNQIIDLTAGTYYFVASRDNSYTGNYSFRLDYTNANESYSETDGGLDNSMASANNISLGTNYNGQIAANDEKDFYRFKLSSQTKLYFTFTANMKWIYCYIYDVSGNQMWRKNFLWNDVTEKIDTLETIDLTAGTYYIIFERDNAYTGSYMFQLASHRHAYKNIVTKATLYRDGEIVKQCTCGAVKSRKTIERPYTITLSSYSYIYDGKVKKPVVKVKTRTGKTISSSNYTVKYAKGRKNVGTYKITIKFKGNYSGNVSRTFTIRRRH